MSDDHMKCCLYNGVKDREGVTVSVLKVLNNIRKGYWKKKLKELEKTQLPGATFSGTFERRRDKDILSHNGIIVMDIDDIATSEAKIIKSALNMDKHCITSFLSPSGKGLKALFLTDCDADTHRDAFDQVLEYCENEYKLNPDRSCRNESRLCFVSYDPAMLIKDAEPFHVFRRKWQDRKVVFPDRIETRDEKIFAIIFKWAQKKYPNNKGNRNNLAHLTACSLNRAGVDEGTAISLLVRYMMFSRDFTRYELERTIKGVYERNRHEHGTNPLELRDSY